MKINFNAGTPRVKVPSGVNPDAKTPKVAGGGGLFKTASVAEDGLVDIDFGGGTVPDGGSSVSVASIGSGASIIDSTGNEISLEGLEEIKDFNMDTICWEITYKDAEGKIKIQVTEHLYDHNSTTIIYDDDENPKETITKGKNIVGESITSYYAGSKEDEKLLKQEKGTTLSGKPAEVLEFIDGDTSKVSRATWNYDDFGLGKPISKVCEFIDGDTSKIAKTTLTYADGSYQVQELQEDGTAKVANYNSDNTPKLNDDGESVVGYYDGENLVKQEIDTNGDGKPDEIIKYKEEDPSKIDSVVIYNDDYSTYELQEYQSDGTIKITEHSADGTPLKSEAGFVTSYYDGKTLLKHEIDTDGDGNPDKTFEYDKTDKTLQKATHNRSDGTYQVRVLNEGGTVTVTNYSADGTELGSYPLEGDSNALLAADVSLIDEKIKELTGTSTSTPGTEETPVATETPAETPSTPGTEETPVATETPSNPPEVSDTPGPSNSPSPGNTDNEPVSPPSTPGTEENPGIGENPKPGEIPGTEETPSVPPAQDDTSTPPVETQPVEPVFAGPTRSSSRTETSTVNGIKITKTYDQDGKLMTEIETGSGMKKTISYDENENITSTTWEFTTEQGIPTKEIYGADGELQHKDWSFANSDGSKRVISINGGGVLSVMDYDAKGKPTGGAIYEQYNQSFLDQLFNSAKRNQKP